MVRSKISAVSDWALDAFGAVLILLVVTLAATSAWFGWQTHVGQEQHSQDLAQIKTLAQRENHTEKQVLGIVAQVPKVKQALIAGQDALIGALLGIDGKLGSIEAQIGAPQPSAPTTTTTSLRPVLPPPSTPTATHASGSRTTSPPVSHRGHRGHCGHGACR